MNILNQRLIKFTVTDILTTIIQSLLTSIICNSLTTLDTYLKQKQNISGYIVQKISNARCRIQVKKEHAITFMQ